MKKNLIIILFMFSTGLIAQQSNLWTTFNRYNSGLIYDEVWDIIETSDGALWFGTHWGVSRYQQGT